MTSINIHGLKTNFEYIVELSKKHDIIFVQETWLANDGELCKLVAKHGLPFSSHHKTTQRKNGVRGRQPGGIAWLVRDSISRSVKCSFVNERLATLEVGDMALVGIYGHFDDGKPETLIECGIETETALRTARELERRNKATIILGDFNADPYRGRRIDKLVCEAMATEGRVLADIQFTQRVDFTFKTKVGSSWIDHVAVNPNDKQVQQINIIDVNTNMSDHRALSISLEVLIEPARKNPMEGRQVTAAGNWKDEDFRIDSE